MMEALVSSEDEKNINEEQVVEYANSEEVEVDVSTNLNEEASEQAEQVDATDKDWKAEAESLAQQLEELKDQVHEKDRQLSILRRSGRK